MLNLKRKRVKEIALYFWAFVCLSVITFFSEPHIDEHIFSVSTDFNLKSIWDYCVGYGNGRLLGNLFCVFFSHIYWLKFVFVSLCVVGLSAILNKLI
ncbi:MAG: hypothetical protein J6L91_08995, partial [Clostridia bacterium]|nr:hypothetical protein [Clostridia bacterium]